MKKRKKLPGEKFPLTRSVAEMRDEKKKTAKQKPPPPIQSDTTNE